MCQVLFCLILVCLGNGLVANGSRRTLTFEGSSLEDNLLNQNMSLKHIVIGFHDRDAVKRINNFTIRSPRLPSNDVVSKNITMVLENLLKNYESSQLPTHGKSR
ncbi:hypothetical protein JTB14_028425 [Gonioctena quinquepunctata]|nr:hypothetical protein JTB14_028425 [Gonioctena quinquepunctata]